MEWKVTNLCREVISPHQRNMEHRATDNANIPLQTVTDWGKKGDMPVSAYPLYCMWAIQGLNLGPPDYESVALTN